MWGGTPSDKPKNKRQRHFNPPSPCGEGLFLLITDGVAFDISIHPPRVGRDLYGGALGQKHHSISIHPPRVGRDATRSARSSPALNFNPPSPCGEGRLATFFKSSGNSRFQSTLPVWGGTQIRDPLPGRKKDFNPPSPCGEGPNSSAQLRTVDGISIHPPRVGRDLLQAFTGMRRAISIHPPRVGRDLRHLPQPPCCYDFNPPSPCGEGPNSSAQLRTVDGISIHPPRVGRDRRLVVPTGHKQYFNPPSPCGEGRCPCLMLARSHGFQSTLPVWGGTAGPGASVQKT